MPPLTSSKKVILYYSPLIQLPVIGQLILINQFLLLYFDFTHRVYLNNQERFLNLKTIKLINKKKMKIICNTFCIGHLLTFLEKKIDLQISHQSFLKIENYQLYQNILWTLFMTDQNEKNLFCF